MTEAMITYTGLLDMQVCVPKDWTDEQVLSFAETNNHCGTSHGWSIRKEGSQYLSGAPERVQCDELSNNVHIILDA